MTDPVNDAAEGFWARINHPVIGVFITSSIIWNWEITYYLIRGVGGSTQTVDFIEHEYLCGANWVNLLFWPGLITAGFLVLAPVLYESYSNYKLLCKGILKKLEPVFNYQYKDTIENYEVNIKSRDASIVTLQKRVDDEMGSRKAEQRIHQADYEKLLASYNVAKRNPVNIPGYRELAPMEYINEFLQNRSVLAETVSRVNFLTTEVAEKNAEILLLNEEILSLQKKK
jgi:hypothetical protein